MTKTVSGANSQVIDVRASRRAIVAGSVGNLVEWYEYALYGYMAPVIAGLFFPTGNGVAGLLATFSLFALAFFLRPVGAAVFGRFADRAGRRPVLVLIITLMSGATALIGVLPTYATIGVWAPLLLTVLRVVQGLAAGGEFGGAVSLMAEYAPPGKRGLYGSWSFFTTVIGFVFGAGMATVLIALLPDDALASWGWRIGFLAAAPMGLVALYLRMRVDETPSFRAATAAPATPTPAAEAAPEPGLLRQVLTTVGIVVVYSCTGYTFMVLMPTYLSKTLGMSLEQSYVLTLINGTVAGLVVPFAGAWSDRVGRRAVMLVGTIGTLVLSYPLFLMLRGGFGAALVALVVAGVLIGLVGGPLPALLSERFPTRTRVTGVALAYAVSVALFGGTAPFIITAVVSATGNSLAAAWYTIACSLITLATLLWLRGAATHREPLRD
ncbi:MFS transporter [Pseudonocardia kujensis]|uniref:MFS transporter n=1 Tax=Pseudonocardia kujensis TaxID=1128675 RepID=UPI001E521267|nr:MFS transporter [Pseudonocardia kujensis]MCE0767026.1 MFS transporter [Pseudonocardia kujensis]